MDRAVAGHAEGGDYALVLAATTRLRGVGGPLEQSVGLECYGITNPFDGCIKRLDRAQACLESLQPIIAGLNVIPDPTNDPLFKMKVDLERETLTIECIRDAVLPIEVGLVFGDIVRGVQATLDNLVYALAEGKVPGDDRSSSFPIPQVLAKIRHLSPQNRALIESIQPFMDRTVDKPHNNLLARIQTYANRDKHQIIPATAAATFSHVIDLIETEGYDISGAELTPGVRLRKKAVVLRARIRRIGDAKQNMHMRGSFNVIPQLPESGEPLEFFCKAAIAYVRDIVNLFAA